MVPWTLSYNLDFCNILQAYSNRTSDGTNMPEGENQTHKSCIFSPSDDVTQLHYALHCHSCIYNTPSSSFSEIAFWRPSSVKIVAH